MNASHNNKNSHIVFRNAVIILINIGACLGFYGCRDTNHHVASMAERDTTLYNIQVIDTEDGRELWVNGRIKDIVDTILWKSHARYIAVMNLPQHFFLTPGTSLLLGMGSSSIMKNYRNEHWTATVVEPDSGIIRTAIAKFHISPRDTSIINTDGRTFLESHSNRYNIILVDGIATGSLPLHLLTKEFFISAHNRLSNDGILAIAVETIGWNDPVVLSISKTLGEVFSETLVLPISEPPNMFGSIVLIAMNTKRDLIRDPDRNYFYHPDWRYGPEYQKVHAWDNHFTPHISGGIIFSDTYNRRDQMFTRIADSARMQPKHYLP